MNSSSEEKRKVSFVCAWYNRPSAIRETMDGMISQSFDDYEIVVVNDGSSDPEVAEILNSYSGSKVKIFHQSNQGFTNAIRRAISLSNSEYIAIQGAGDISFPDRLSRQVSILDEFKDVVAVGCQVQVSSLSSGNSYIKSVSENPDRNIRKSRIPRTGTHGATMMRRSSYNLIGGYRPGFKYAQDSDLLLRLSEIGGIKNSKEVLYKKVAYDDGVSFKNIKQQIFFSTIAIQSAFLREKLEDDFFSSLDPAHWERYLDKWLFTKRLMRRRLSHILRMIQSRRS